MNLPRYTPSQLERLQRVTKARRLGPMAAHRIAYRLEKMTEPEGAVRDAISAFRRGKALERRPFIHSRVGVDEQGRPTLGGRHCCALTAEKWMTTITEQVLRTNREYTCADCGALWQIKTELVSNG